MATMMKKAGKMGKKGLLNGGLSPGLSFTVKSDDAQTDAAAYDRMKDKVMEEVKRFFRPEFLNRIDATVVFHQLTREQLGSIVEIQLQHLNLA